MVLFHPFEYGCCSLLSDKNNEGDILILSARDYRHFPINQNNAGDVLILSASDYRHFPINQNNAGDVLFEKCIKKEEKCLTARFLLQNVNSIYYEKTLYFLFVLQK